MKDLKLNKLLNLMLEHSNLTSKVQDFNTNIDCAAEKSQIQIDVGGEICGAYFSGCYQTSDTYDCQYVSSNLKFNQDEHKKLYAILNIICEFYEFDDMKDFELREIIYEFEKQLKIKLKIQEKFESYIKEAYPHSTDEMPNNAMDANSEQNELSPQ